MKGRDIEHSQCAGIALGIIGSFGMPIKCWHSGYKHEAIK